MWKCNLLHDFDSRFLPFRVSSLYRYYSNVDFASWYAIRMHHGREIHPIPYYFVIVITSPLTWSSDPCLSAHPRAHSLRKSSMILLIYYSGVLRESRATSTIGDPERGKKKKRKLHCVRRARARAMTHPMAASVSMCARACALCMHARAFVPGVSRHTSRRRLYREKSISRAPSPLTLYFEY